MPSTAIYPSSFECLLSASVALLSVLTSLLQGPLCSECSGRMERFLRLAFDRWITIQPWYVRNETKQNDSLQEKRIHNAVEARVSLRSTLLLTICSIFGALRQFLVFLCKSTGVTSTLAQQLVDDDIDLGSDDSWFFFETEVKFTATPFRVFPAGWVRLVWDLKVPIACQLLVSMAHQGPQLPRARSW